jgi:pectate lyase
MIFTGSTKMTTSNIFNLLTLTGFIIGLTACGGEGTGSNKSSSSSSQAVISSSMVTMSSSKAATSSQAITSSSKMAMSSSQIILSSSRSSIATTSAQTSSRSSIAEVRAFPSAEGFAAMATGGRGGRVIKVTNLNASGAGSLRAALQETGPRIVVFAVSGSIKILGSNGNAGGILYVGDGDLTIAGQTAPGAGITLEGRLYVDDGQENIIIRHMRIRPHYDNSAVEQFDAIRVYGGRLVMMDHLSLSFGVDEIVDLYEATDITVQWSTIESADETNDHNYGLLNGQDGKHVSVLNNLFAHNRNRNPAISNGPADVINNVVYNTRHAFHHDDPTRGGEFNIVGNYYKAGPSSDIFPTWFDPSGADVPRVYYVNDNWLDLAAANQSECVAGLLNNPWQQCEYEVSNSNYRASSLFNFSSVDAWRAPQIKSYQEAYTNVLAKAGAFPRDQVTLRTVSETKNRTGSWGARRPSDLLQGLTPTQAPVDNDNDGMSDEWETQQGLNINVADHNTIMPSGYTAIEEYINQLASALTDD